jgi:hypothetical protein
VKSSDTCKGSTPLLSANTWRIKMFIKIGDKLFSSNGQPIMVILSDEDKENIKGMDKSARKYAEYCGDLTVEYIKEWMDKAYQCEKCGWVGDIDFCPDCNIYLK